LVGSVQESLETQDRDRSAIKCFRISKASGLTTRGRGGSVVHLCLRRELASTARWLSCREAHL